MKRIILLLSLAMLTLSVSAQNFVQTEVNKNLMCRSWFDADNQPDGYTFILSFNDYAYGSDKDVSRRATVFVGDAAEMNDYITEVMDFIKYAKGKNNVGREIENTIVLKTGKNLFFEMNDNYGCSRIMIGESAFKNIQKTFLKYCKKKKIQFEESAE